MFRTFCESTPMVLEFLRAQDVDVERRHETGAESDSLLCSRPVSAWRSCRAAPRLPALCFASWWRSSSSIAQSISMALPDVSAPRSPLPL